MRYMKTGTKSIHRKQKFSNREIFGIRSCLHSPITINYMENINSKNMAPVNFDIFSHFVTLATLISLCFTFSVTVQ